LEHGAHGETFDNSEFVEGGKPYTMTGIGIEKALQIAYRTLMQYATSQSQYADIRLCHIHSAKDLYGDNSTEVEAVAKAWDIVGVTDGETTDIILNTNRTNGTNPDDARYDLQGRKIVKPSNGQMPKGIYIYQGKKQIIK
jgi:hypothetical protein